MADYIEDRAAPTRARSVQGSAVAMARFAAARPLLVIVAAGLVIRVLAAILFTGPIDTEGAEYARIAVNLRSGAGSRESPSRAPNCLLRRSTRSQSRPWRPSRTTPRRPDGPSPC